MSDEVAQLYDHVAEKYLTNRSKASNDVTELPKMIELVGDVANKKLLDLGCGLGKHAKAYLDKGAEVTGVDASQKMVQIANENCGNRATILRENFESVEFPEDSFDIVTSSFAIHYLEKLEPTITKIHSWIKPEGRFIFSIFHPIQYFLRTENFDYSESKKVEVYLKGYDLTLFNYYHPLEEYFRVINKAGFNLDKFIETTIPKNVIGWPEAKYRIPNAIIFELGK